VRLIAPKFGYVRLIVKNTDGMKNLFERSQGIGHKMNLVAKRANKWFVKG
jgi:hypothetical protein